MATTTKQLDPVAELEAAEADLALLRKRIGSRDAKVTPADLERAESAVRFARTRVEASAEFEADQREQERRDRIEAIRQGLPATFDLTALDQARKDLEAAADAYCREARALEVRTGEVWNELTGMAPTLGVTPLTGDGSIQASGVVYRKPSFQRQLRDAVCGAFHTHFPRTEIRLNRA